MTTTVFWRNHRVGLIDTQFMRYPVKPPASAAKYKACCELETVTLPNKMHITEVSALGLAYNRDFAELYGITGCDFEPED